MNLPVLSQIEESINQLPLDEQLWLIERVAQRIRANIVSQNAWDNELAQMASDIEIQNELRKIDAEFAPEGIFLSN